MTEKIISEINLELVFKCNEFSQFSNTLKDSKNKLIFESNFWEKVFLSWINKLPNCIFEKKSFSLGLQIISNQEIAFMNQKWMQKNGPSRNCFYEPEVDAKKWTNRCFIFSNHF